MHTRRFLMSMVAVAVVGCDTPPVAETFESWGGFNSSGWYAVEKSEWNDCAVSVEQVTESELKLTFDMQDAAHATWRNHDLENRDWSGYRALLLDFDNSLDEPLGLIVYLSNEPKGSAWTQSIRFTIPVGRTSDLRVDLLPNAENKGPPKDWDLTAWQFKGLKLDNIQRIAISVRGEQGLQGSIAISNPRFAKLAR